MVGYTCLDLNGFPRKLGNTGLQKMTFLYVIYFWKVKNMMKCFINSHARRSTNL
jgi:hypothetical protein